MFNEATEFGIKLCNWEIPKEDNIFNILVGSKCEVSTCFACTYAPTSSPSSTLLPSSPPSSLPSSSPTLSPTSLSSDEPSFSSISSSNTSFPLAPSFMPSNVSTSLPSSSIPVSSPSRLNLAEKVVIAFGCAFVTGVIMYIYFNFFRTKCNVKRSNIVDVLEGSDEENPESDSRLTDRLYSTSEIYISNTIEIDPLKLTIDERIGKGSFSNVYAAKYGHGNKTLPVALKVLKIDGEFLSYEQFQPMNDEVRLLSTFIYHLNIITFLGACVNTEITGNDGEPIAISLGMIMELSPIGTLTRYLQELKFNQITEKLCKSLALDIAHGIHALHSCVVPIIHRDLKSENILLFPGRSHYGKNIVAKIADFGVVSID